MLFFRKHIQYQSFHTQFSCVPNQLSPLPHLSKRFHSTTQSLPIPPHISLTLPSNRIINTQPINHIHTTHTCTSQHNPPPIRTIRSRIYAHIMASPINSNSSEFILQNEQKYTQFRMDVDDIISRLNYTIRLPHSLHPNYIKLGADLATRDFITESVRKYHRCFCINHGIALMRSLLATCGMAHTDIIGFLNVGSMHIISAKQLQLLLQHSYQVEKPVNSDEFEKIDLKAFLDEYERENKSSIINGQFSSTARRQGISSTAFGQNNDKRNMGTALPSFLQNGQNETQSLIGKKNTPNKSSKHTTHTQLASSLLGIQSLSESDDDCNNGNSFSEKSSQAEHLLNLNNIFNAPEPHSTSTTTTTSTLTPSTITTTTILGSSNNINYFTQKSASSTLPSFSDILSDATKDLSSNSMNNYADQSYQQVFFGKDQDYSSKIVDDDLLPLKFGTMLDIGAGSGRMAELLAPIFDKIECTEVSEQMVNVIKKKGFTAYYNDNIDHLPPENKYDVICLFNLIDRCDEPISLMYQLHKRLKPILESHRASLLHQLQKSMTIVHHTRGGAMLTTQKCVENTDHDSNEDNNNEKKYTNLNGRVVIAVPLPLRPSVEMTLDNHTRTWRKPIEDISQKKCWCCTTYEESLQHLIINIIEPCGYDVLSFTRLPYLSEGNQYATHFVLEDIILVCAPKAEWTL